MKPPFLSLAAAALALAATSPAFAADKKLWAKSIIGQHAPELKVEEWVTAPPETKGKFVLIDFWATWCPPCREAIPELNGFQKKFRDRLVVIGISEEPKDVIAGFAKPKPEYAFAVDTKGETKKSLEVTGIPHVLLIDPSGIVRWEGFPFLGGHELTEQVVADVIGHYGGAEKVPAPTPAP